MGAVALAGSLTSCAPGRTGSLPTGASARPPAPVNEALWVADESGTLHSYDGRVNRVTAQVRTGLTSLKIPPALVGGGGLIWAYGLDGKIAIVDPAQARVTGRAAVPAADPLGIFQAIYGHGALWIVQQGRLWRLMPSAQVSAVPQPSGFGPYAAAVTPQALWLCGSGGQLVRVDPTSLTTTPGPRLPAAASLTGGTTAMYAVPGNEPTIWLLDPHTATIMSTVEMPNDELVFEVLEAGSNRWAIGNSGTVAGISGGGDPAVTRRTRISDTSQHFPSAMGLGSLWICDEVHSKLIRLDLGTGKVAARIPVTAADPDDPAFAVLAGEHSVWLVDSNLADGVQRVDPWANRAMRLKAPSGITSGMTAVVAAPPPRST